MPHSSPDEARAMLSRPLDRSSELPIGTQLAWRLRAVIASGALGPGDRLPSARELAAQAGVNVNTVVAVYLRLEAEGLIAAEHGRGTFVREGARTGGDAASLAATAADAAHAAGVDPRAVAMSLFASSGPPAPRPAPAALDLRMRLRQEIARLELELARLEPPAELEAGSRGAPDPRVLDSDALRTLRDELRVRVATAKRRREQVGLERRYSAASTTVDRARPAASRQARPVSVRWTAAWRTS